MKKKRWVSTPSLLIKCTSRLNVLRVRYCAHGGRDTFQIVIKDCPKTTHAFSGVAAILGSWHVSVFAVLCPRRQTYGVSHTIAFSVACVPVKMLYRLFLWMPILAPEGFWSCLPKDTSGNSSQTRPCSWKEMDCCLKTVVISNARPRGVSLSGCCPRCQTLLCLQLSIRLLDMWHYMRLVECFLRDYDFGATAFVTNRNIQHSVNTKWNWLHL